MPGKLGGNETFIPIEEVKNFNDQLPNGLDAMPGGIDTKLEVPANEGQNEKRDRQVLRQIDRLIKIGDNDSLVVQHLPKQGISKGRWSKVQPVGAVDFMLECRYSLPQASGQDAREISRARQVIVEHVGMDGQPEVDLRSYGITISSGRGQQALVAYAEETGPGILLHDRFIPLKPGLYKLGYAPGEDTLSIEPGTNPVKVDDLDMHSNDGQNTFPSAALLLVKSGGDRRVTAQIATVTDTFVPALSPYQQLVFGRTKDLREHESNVATPDLTPYYQVLPAEKEAATVHTKVIGSAMARLYTVRPDERDPTLEVKEIRAVREKLEHLMKDTVTHLLKEGAQVPQVGVRLNETSTGIQELAFADLTLVQARELLGIGGSAKSLVDSLPVANRGLRFKSVVSDGKTHSAEVEFPTGMNWGPKTSKVPTVLDKGGFNGYESEGSITTTDGFEAKVVVEYDGDKHYSLKLIPRNADAQSITEYMKCVERGLRPVR